MSNSYFSSDIPYTLFSGDLNQYSLHDLTEDNKKFLWHQFMLNVLLNIPRSLTSNEDIIVTCSRLANENDVFASTGRSSQTGYDKFRANYRSDDAINWYTRSSFLYLAFNKACRMLNSDAIIPFHPIIKDLTTQLKQLYKKQKQDGTLKFPFTVYRGQTHFGKGELEKIQANVGRLISMNTFLSASSTSNVATNYIEDVNEVIPVIFEITVNDSENKERSQIFACIDKQSVNPDEKEVLFGMSSVFKIISVDFWECFWEVKLELASCEDDKYMQKFMDEIKNYLYQISGKQAPFIVFKQLFTSTSLSQVRPFNEFVKYFLIDIAELFVINAYNKGGQLKQLIDMESDLYKLRMKNNTDNIHLNERVIYLLFDLLNNFYYYKNKNIEEEISFDKDDVLSLYCFGGFLILTGEYDKAIDYFQILLKHNSINEKIKSSIYAILGAIYIMMKDKQSASQYIHNALQSFESSMEESTPPWLAASIASSFITQEDPNKIPEILQPFINKEHSDNDVLEKIKLIHLGHIHSEQKRFVEALNHLEAALEITSYIPSSIITMLNGAIYVQMAAAYFRLDNISKALNVMEIAKQSLEKYYPSTHRSFAGFNLLYGYYLILNEKSSQSISCLNKALENPYFSNDKDFLGIIYSLLIMSYIHHGNLDKAEEYCHKAQPYISSNNISSQIPNLLNEIPEMKMMVQCQNPDYPRQVVSTGLEEARKLLLRAIRKFIRPSQSIDEQNSTIDQLITTADYYRHRQDYKYVKNYYTKIFNKLTENDSKYLWNIYKKIVRMNNNDQYEDYFTILYSKYDDDNPQDFQIISTLQIINYKLNLSENRINLAFNCLIHGIFMKIKYLYYQNTIDSNYIYDLFHNFVNEEIILKIIFLLTKLIDIYFTDYSKFLQEFFSIYFSFNDLYKDLAKIIHHEQINDIINEIQSKSLSSFANALLKLVRQSIFLSEKSILSLKDQLLEFIQKYNDENAPLFYLMKIFQALLINDIKSFYFNLDKFRLNKITFEHYEKLKEKLSNLFEQLEEDWLYKSLQNIATNLLIQ